ncbi:MAG: DNA-binding protein [Campylobacterales bacterium]|nr:DNA-binding protein [Campylobacterales bacterium]
MINQNIEVGRVNRLRVYKSSDFGLFLESNSQEEVLLPNAYCTNAMQIDDEIEVFIYHDSEDRLVATTQRPYAMLDEYFYAKVVDYRQYGAFVDWGLPKDLFVPLSQQKAYFNIDKYFILRVCQDEETGRLYGTHKIGKYIVRDLSGLHKNQKLPLIVIAQTPLGYKVIADNQYEGMLFANEIFEPIEIGDRKEAYIKTIRRDGKLDLSLQPIGKSQSNHDAFLTLLKANPQMNYKSSPEDIQEIFKMSKKNYKRNLTLLVEAKKITIDQEGRVVIHE